MVQSKRLTVTAENKYTHYIMTLHIMVVFENPMERYHRTSLSAVRLFVNSNNFNGIESNSTMSSDMVRDASHVATNKRNATCGSLRLQCIPKTKDLKYIKLEQLIDPEPPKRIYRFTKPVGEEP